MPAYANIDPAIDGLQYGMNPRIESAIAQEPINYGVAVFGKDGVDNAVWGTHQDQALVTATGALVGSNVITVGFTWTPTTGTLAGVAQVISGITTTFSGDDATTITNIIANINANAAVIAINAAVPGSLKALASPAGTAYQWALQGDAGDITAVTAVVTAGGGQVTYSTVYSEFKRFLGVTAFTQRGGRLYGAGTSKFNQYDAVDIVTLGELWVSTGGVTTIKNGTNAYVIVAPGTTQGQFNATVTTPNFNPQCHFRSNYNAGRALLGVRYGITP